ncbi:GA-binding protein alpha chain isoform X2 [Ambystoma mexicanum]|uniref:GA-binding protein alpha chain isoform X2 n=1 Tax=Ambystoma mexicanum TaxID=8296 RepID=UPI0037E9460E
MTKREAEELIEIEIDGTERAECTEESVVEQTYTTAEFVSQAIDINEPIGNLKKLLEPRLQCSLEAHEICLQDIQLDPERSLFDQGVKTDGTVQLSVQVISRQGMEPKLNILEIVKPVETVEVVIDPDAHHGGAEAQLVEETQVITLDGTKHITTMSDETSEQVTRWAAALEGYRKEQERLGIPYDPIQWSTDQVLHWVVWVIKEFGMDEIDISSLSMPGQDLCELSQEDFFQRVPRGEILWSHLELLRKYVLASQENSGEIATVTIDQPVQIIPASLQSSTPTTIKVINNTQKTAKVQRAPRISGEDRSSPGNRTGTDEEDASQDNTARASTSHPKKRATTTSVATKQATASVPDRAQTQPTTPAASVPDTLETQQPTPTPVEGECLQAPANTEDDLDGNVDQAGVMEVTCLPSPSPMFTPPPHIQPSPTYSSADPCLHDSDLSPFEEDSTENAGPVSAPPTTPAPTNTLESRLSRVEARQEATSELLRQYIADGDNTRRVIATAIAGTTAAITANTAAVNVSVVLMRDCLGAITQVLAAILLHMQRPRLAAGVELATDDSSATTPASSVPTSPVRQTRRSAMHTEMPPPDSKKSRK